MTKSIDYQSFPVTRFRGSKRKLLPWIYESVQPHTYESVLDAFGGSSSVSYLFKRTHKKVTYNDNLKFNQIIGRAIIENDGFLVSRKELSSFLKMVDQEDPSSLFISENFQGLYFTDPENIYLDKFLAALGRVKFKGGTKYKKAILLYALFQSCLIKRPYNLFHRANLGMRIKDVERSFGNKVTWDRPFEYYISKFVKECNSIVFNNGHKCKSTNKDAFRIRKSYDLVYLDPPYIDDKLNESSDYLKCYHFLEGLANYSEWSSMIDYSSTILKLDDSKINKSIKQKDKFEMIEALVKRYKDSIIVLSYKVDNAEELSKIRDIVGGYKEHLSVQTVRYSYALSINQESQECLIVGS